MTTVLSFEDVCFAYAHDEVLHNVDLSIEAGSMVAVVGPNGGGKSTLLRLALGLHTPQRGNILVFGDAPLQARDRIGFVPQQLEFDPRFPVLALDVVLMGRIERHLTGPYRRADRRAAELAMERVDVAHLAGRPLAQLSGGERQRVMIARALIAEPELLLLDEPTASVDVSHEQTIYALLHKLSRTMTVVAVSHNLGVVSRLATHVVCVNRTTSIHPLTALGEDAVSAAFRGDMAVLQHAASCHVIDPTTIMDQPHSDGCCE